MFRRLAAAAAVIVAVLAVLALATPAGASTGPYLFSKGNDFQGTSISVGLGPEAQRMGVTLPPVTQGCGIWGGVQYGRSDPSICQVGSVPIVEDYSRLAALLAAGYRGQVMYDMEPWSFTPRAQWTAPVTYTRKAAGLARQYGVKLIMTYGGDGSQGLNFPANYVAAAKAGVWEVSVQSQGAREAWVNGSWNVAHWGAYWGRYVSAVRAAGMNVHIQLGLATNTPKPIPGWVIKREYGYGVVHWGIRRWWLNACPWSPTRCAAAAGSYGCPVYGVRFLAAEG